MLLLTAFGAIFYVALAEAAGPIALRNANVILIDLWVCKFTPIAWRERFATEWE
jgi:hypothetical protein